MTIASLMLVGSRCGLRRRIKPQLPGSPMFYGDDSNTSTTADHPLLRRPHWGA